MDTPNMPETIAPPAPKKKVIGDFKSLHAIRSILIGRHAAIDAGATRYVWYRSCPTRLKARVAEGPPAPGVSHWRCEPNGNVEFVKGTEEKSPRAWEMPTVPLTRRTAEKLQNHGIEAITTDDPRWVQIFQAFGICDFAHVNGWSPEMRAKIKSARTLAKQLVAEVRG